VSSMPPISRQDPHLHLSKAFSLNILIPNFERLGNIGAAIGFFCFLFFIRCGGGEVAACIGKTALQTQTLANCDLVNIQPSPPFLGGMDSPPPSRVHFVSRFN
jgi:hypothetical protein